MTQEDKPTCPGCGGTGKCFKCDGSGHVLHDLPTPITVISGTVRSESGSGQRRTCPRCYGSGHCSMCKGTGKAS